MQNLEGTDDQMCRYRYSPLNPEVQGGARIPNQAFRHADMHNISS